MRERRRPVPAAAGGAGGDILGRHDLREQRGRVHLDEAGPRRRTRDGDQGREGPVGNRSMRPLCLFLILLAGCQRPAATLPARLVNKPKSPPGWEIRYNAVLGLLRRGSLNITGADVWDTVTEM